MSSDQTDEIDKQLKEMFEPQTHHRFCIKDTEENFNKHFEFNSLKLKHCEICGGLRQNVIFETEKRRYIFALYRVESLKGRKIWETDYPKFWGYLYRKFFKYKRKKKE